MRLVTSTSAQMRGSQQALASCAPRIIAARPMVPSRLNQMGRSRNIMLASSSEENATDTIDNIDSESQLSSEAEVMSDESSAVSRMKKLLKSEGELDRAALESAISEIDSEISRMAQGAEMAELRALSSEASLATMKDQFLRLNADFDNFRRRTKDEKDLLKDSLRGDIVTSLLPVVDNFELARTQVKAETEGEVKINNSYQSLYKQFVDFLRSLGVEAVATVGLPFDPNFHEAIMKEASNEVPDNTVLMEFRKGFKIGDKLLRPAMVKVSENDGLTAPMSSSEE